MAIVPQFENNVSELEVKYNNDSHSHCSNDVVIKQEYVQNSPNVQNDSNGQIKTNYQKNSVRADSLKSSYDLHTELHPDWKLTFFSGNKKQWFFPELATGVENPAHQLIEGLSRYSAEWRESTPATPEKKAVKAALINKKFIPFTVESPAPDPIDSISLSLGRRSGGYLGILARGSGIAKVKESLQGKETFCFKVNGGLFFIFSVPVDYWTQIKNNKRFNFANGSITLFWDKSYQKLPLDTEYNLHTPVQPFTPALIGLDELDITDTDDEGGFLVQVGSPQYEGKSGADMVSFPNYWKKVKKTMRSLGEEIHGKGRAIKCALIDEKRDRKQIYCNYAEITGFDVDSYYTREDVLNHPFVLQYGGLVIESSSSKPDHFKGRIFFRFENPLVGWETIRAVNQYIFDTHLNHSDPAPIQSGSYLFGGKGKPILFVNEDNRIPQSLVDEAIAYVAEKTKTKKQPKATEDFKGFGDRVLSTESSNDEWTKHLARLAWEYAAETRVPLTNQRDRLIRPVWSLQSALGASETYSLASSYWQADLGGLQGIIDSYNSSSPITIATVFGLAAQKGWVRPAYTRENCEAAGVPWVPKKKENLSKRIIRQIKSSKEKKVLELNPTAVPSLQTQATEKNHDKWKNRHKYTPTNTIAVDRLSLEPVKPLINSDTWLFMVRSGLGTGKTFLLTVLIPYLQSIGKIRGGRMAGSRNSLNSQTGGKIGSKSIAEASWQELNSHDNIIDFCWDSVEKLPNNDDYWDDKILILDENVSSLKHVIAGGTCIRNRTEKLARLAHAVKRSAFIICLDGNNADWCEKYLKTLRGNDSGIVKLLNEQQPQTIPLQIIPEFRQSGNISKIISVMPLVRRQGKAIAIPTDSLRLSKKLTLLFRDRGYKVLCINSETMTQPEIKAWVKNPVRSDYDILIFTPTCESGLDISFDGFLYTYAFFCGIVDTATQIQMLRRVRHVEGIFVQCVPYTRAIFNKSTIFTDFQNEMEDALLDDGEQHLDLMTRWLEKHKNDPHYQEYCRIVYFRNHERRNTLQCFVDLAIDHGYDPQFIEDIEDKELDKELKGLGREIRIQEATAILTARDLTTGQALAIKSKYNPTLEEHWALQRWEIKDQLPGFAEAENGRFWNVDDLVNLRDGWRDLPSLKLLWHCQNLDKSKIMADKRWRDWLDQDRFAGDCLSVVYAKAKLINSLGILDMQGTVISADSDKVKQLVKDGINKRVALRSRLGAVMGGRKPMEWVKALLGYVGLKVKQSGRSFGATRQYEIAPFDDLFKTVLDCLSISLETQYQQALEAYQPTNIYEHKYGGVGIEVQEQELPPPPPPAIVPAAAPPNIPINNEPPDLDNLKKGDRIIFWDREAIFVGMWLGSKRIEFADTGMELDIKPANWKDIQLPRQLTAA